MYFTQVGTGPTRWMLVFQDTLSISALLLMSLGAYVDSSLVMAIAGFVLGMSTRLKMKDLKLHLCFNSYVMIFRFYQSVFYS